MENIEYREAISEVLEILKHTEKSLVDKIPKTFMNFLEKNQSSNYVAKYNHTKVLSEMNLREKTKDIFAVIYMKYWCLPEEADNYKKVLKKNQKELEIKKHEKYNPDDIFKRKTIEDVLEEEKVENNVALTEFKENIFRKIMRKIKSIFCK